MRRHHLVIHPRNLLWHLIDQIRGREQMLVRAGEDLPRVVISYPQGKVELAEALRAHMRREEEELIPAMVEGRYRIAR